MIKIITALFFTASVFASEPPKKEELIRPILRRSGVSIRYNLNELALVSSNLAANPLMNDSALLRYLQKKESIERKIERQRKNIHMQHAIRDMWQ